MMWTRLKNYFLAGLVAVLPLWVTYVVLRALFFLMASVSKPVVASFSPIRSNPLLLDVVSFLGTIFVVIFLGMILTNVFGRRLFLKIEKRFQRIPVLSWIYVSIRKLTALFYQEDGESRFRRVVMLEYPRKGIFVIGFMTTDVISDINNKANSDMVNVFVPTTPNPTSGFLLLVPKNEIQLLDMSMEDAVKLIVSAGVSSPEGA